MAQLGSPKAARSPIGFVTSGPPRDEDMQPSGRVGSPVAAEIHAIYVAPDAWRKGAGRALTAAEGYWFKRGTTTLVLWVLGNEQPPAEPSTRRWVGGPTARASCSTLAAPRSPRSATASNGDARASCGLRYDKPLLTEGTRSRHALRSSVGRYDAGLTSRAEKEDLMGASNERNQALRKLLVVKPGSKVRASARASRLRQTLGRKQARRRPPRIASLARLTDFQGTASTPKRSTPS